MRKRPDNEYDDLEPERYPESRGEAEEERIFSRSEKVALDEKAERQGDKGNAGKIGRPFGRDAINIREKRDENGCEKPRPPALADGSYPVDGPDKDGVIDHVAHGDQHGVEAGPQSVDGGYEVEEIGIHAGGEIPIGDKIPYHCELLKEGECAVAYVEEAIVEEQRD